MRIATTPITWTALVCALCLIIVGCGSSSPSSEPESGTAASAKTTGNTAKAYRQDGDFSCPLEETRVSAAAGVAMTALDPGANSCGFSAGGEGDALLVAMMERWDGTAADQRAAVEPQVKILRDAGRDSNLIDAEVLGADAFEWWTPSDGGDEYADNEMFTVFSAPGGHAWSLRLTAGDDYPHSRGAMRRLSRKLIKAASGE